MLPNSYKFKIILQCLWLSVPVCIIFPFYKTYGWGKCALHPKMCNTQLINNLLSWIMMLLLALGKVRLAIQSLLAQHIPCAGTVLLIYLQLGTQSHSAMSGSKSPLCFNSLSSNSLGKSNCFHLAKLTDIPRIMHTPKIKKFINFLNILHVSQVYCRTFENFRK